MTKKIKNVYDNLKETSNKSKDIAIRVQDVQDRIYDLLYNLSAVQESISNLNNRIAELEHKLDDSSIRIHDTQDRAYDILYKTKNMEKKINNLESSVKNINSNTLDAKIRTHDTQNRTYDIIYKNNAATRQRDLMFWSIYKQKNESLQDAKIRFFKSLPKSEGDMKLKQEAVSVLIKRFDQICKENNIQYWLDFGTMIGAFRHNGFVPWDDDADVGMLRKDVEKFIEVVDKYKDVKLNNYYSIPDVNCLHILRFGFNDDIQLFLDIFVYDYTTREDSSDAIWKDYLSIRKDYNDEARKYAPSEKEILNETDNVAKHRITNKTKLKKILALEKKYTKKFNDILGTTDKKTSRIMWSVENWRLSRVRVLDTDLIFPLKEYKFDNRMYYGPNKALEYLTYHYGDIFSLPNDLYAHEHIKLDDAEKDRIRKIVKEQRDD